MPFDRLFIIAPLVFLAACGSGGESRPKSVSTAQAPLVLKPSRLPPVRSPVQERPSAQRLVAPGLESVVGATRDDLIRQFGPARLDIWEGDARKLQFSGPICVLDVYLYPSAPGKEPQASFLDTRNSTDGKDVERAICITALRRR